MKRRDFLAYGVAASAARLARPARARAKTGGPAFKLKYAPHIGMFEAHAGKDPVDQINFMADQGFTAFEDNEMARRPVEVQNKIRKALDERNMTMGVFVASADFRRVTFASDKMAVRSKFLKDMKLALEVAKRVGAKWCTVVPGRENLQMQREFQTAIVIDNLRRCCEILEKDELVMVLEPLNFRDHPGLFLKRSSQAHMICRAVDHPSCRILFDIYHQQISEGNLIPNIESAFGEIAYFQVGDNPGRKEPTTGEINYKNVFKRIHELGFTGVVGMEHGKSKPGKEGERALIDAYLASDDF
ncbi:MAG: hydroxypyruvate isomerase family protein [Planctomycetota bacterium]